MGQETDRPESPEQRRPEQQDRLDRAVCVLTQEPLPQNEHDRLEEVVRRAEEATRLLVQESNEP